MSIAERNAELLRTIADAVGTDVGTFIALGRLGGTDACASDGPHRDGRGMPLLLRLVALFRNLPDDASRLQALLILEAFTARINEAA